jgi:hypothetical protein
VEPRHDRAASNHLPRRRDDCRFLVSDIPSHIIATIDLLELLGEERIAILVKNPVTETLMQVIG